MTPNQKIARVKSNIIAAEAAKRQFKKQGMDEWVSHYNRILREQKTLLQELKTHGYTYREDLELARDLMRNGPTRLIGKKFNPKSDLEACMIK